MILVVVFVALIAAGILVALVGIHIESRAYNNGVCPVCGHELMHFATDSKGSRGYFCKDCDYVAWVSYSIVDKVYD